MIINLVFISISSNFLWIVVFKCNNNNVYFQWNSFFKESISILKNKEYLQYKTRWNILCNLYYSELFVVTILKCYVLKKKIKRCVKLHELMVMCIIFIDWSNMFLWDWITDVLGYLGKLFILYNNVPCYLFYLYRYNFCSILRTV